MTDNLTVKAGKYFVGDPSQVIPCTQTWIDLMRSADYFDSADVGFISGTPVYGVMLSSAPDKVHPTNQGFGCSTNSGIIGLVPESLVKLAVGPCGLTDEAMEQLNWVTFPVDVTFQDLDHDEELHIGHLVIYPSVEPEEWHESSLAPWAENEDDEPDTQRLVDFAEQDEDQE